MNQKLSIKESQKEKIRYFAKIVVRILLINMETYIVMYTAKQSFREEKSMNIFSLSLKNFRELIIIHPNGLDLLF